MATKRSYNVSALPFTIFSHLLAVAIIVLLLIWLLHFREGFAFTSDVKSKIFNMHPLLMVIGFVLITGEAIMAYKTIPAARNTQKLFHLLLHLTSLACGIAGIIAIFKFHSELGIQHIYTLHSWLGMATICLFGLQWLFSFLYFWYPKASASKRAKVAPWHIVFGLMIFFMAILSSLTGLVERFIFLKLVRDVEALIVNFIGLLILLFAISTGLSVLLPHVKYT